MEAIGFETSGRLTTIQRQKYKLTNNDTKTLVSHH